MSRIIAVALSKGGVGKTTTAVNLAAALSLAKKRVLLIDTDTQGQAGQALGVNASVGLAEVVSDGIPLKAAITRARLNLDLLTGGPRLAGVKREIARAEFGGERILDRALNALDNNYDHVIIDTAPGWDALQVNVLFYAREVLAPVPLETMAVQGLVTFMNRIGAIQEYNQALQLRYVLPTGLDRRVKQSSEILGQLQERLGALVCEPIRYNVRLSEAPAHGLHIFEYSPGSVGAADYATLALRILSDE
jgi:chromosome partitioning protein